MKLGKKNSRRENTIFYPIFTQPGRLFKCSPVCINTLFFTSLWTIPIIPLKRFMSLSIMLPYWPSMTFLCLHQEYSKGHLIYSEWVLPLPAFKIECLCQVNHCMVVSASPNPWLVRIDVELWCCERSWFSHPNRIALKILVKIVQS